MNTEHHAWNSTRFLAATACSTYPRVCGCGQELDVCSGTHCPRCGTSFTAHAA